MEKYQRIMDVHKIETYPNLTVSNLIEPMLNTLSYQCYSNPALGYPTSVHIMYFYYKTKRKIENSSNFAKVFGGTPKVPLGFPVRLNKLIVSSSTFPLF